MSPECPTRRSHKSVLQECSARASHKSVPQECPTRVSYKTFPQECPTRVSKIVWVFAFEYMSAFGFVGSILFIGQVAGVANNQQDPIGDSSKQSFCSFLKKVSRENRVGNALTSDAMLNDSFSYNQAQPLPLLAIFLNKMSSVECGWAACKKAVGANEAIYQQSKSLSECFAKDFSVAPRRAITTIVSAHKLNDPTSEAMTHISTACREKQ